MPLYFFSVDQFPKKLLGSHVPELVRYSLDYVHWHRALHTDQRSEQAETWEYLTVYRADYDFSTEFIWKFNISKYMTFC